MFFLKSFHQNLHRGFLSENLIRTFLKFYLLITIAYGIWNEMKWSISLFIHLSALLDACTYCWCLITVLINKRMLRVLCGMCMQVAVVCNNVLSMQHFYFELLPFWCWSIFYIIQLLWYCNKESSKGCECSLTKTNLLYTTIRVTVEHYHYFTIFFGSATKCEDHKLILMY